MSYRISPISTAEANTRDTALSVPSVPNRWTQDIVVLDLFFDPRNNLGSHVVTVIRKCDVPSWLWFAVVTTLV